MSSPAHWGWGVAGGAGLGYFAFGDEWYEIGAGAALGTPWGHKALASGTRSAVHGVWWAGTRLAGTAFVRNAAWRTAGFAGSAAVAVAAPVAIGGLASYAIAGDEGLKDYGDYMHSFNPFSDRGITVGDWWDAVTLKSMR